MLTIRTVNPATVFGLTSVHDFHPVRLVPFETRVEPTLTLSTQKPVGYDGSVPSVAGSLNARNARSTDCPAYAERSQLCGLNPADEPVKPGRFSTAVVSAPGSASVLVSVHARLVYVAPPSTEIWAKPKSQVSSSFQRASNVSFGEPLGTLTVVTIASSRSSAAPDERAALPSGVGNGGLASTVHFTGLVGSVFEALKPSEVMS